jgi:NADH-quinone oxidoreductase subunit M
MNITDLPWLTIVTFLPLVGAIVIAFLPRDAVGATRAIALGTALAAWVVSLLLLVGVDGRVAGGSEFSFVESVVWIPAFGIQY